MSSRDPVELAVVGAQRALRRLAVAAASHPRDFEVAHIAACEAVLSLVIVDDVLRGPSTNPEQRVQYEQDRQQDTEGEQLLGLRHIRNFIAHQPVLVAHSGAKPFWIPAWDEKVHGPKPSGAIYLSSPFVWPPAAAVPLHGGSYLHKKAYAIYSNKLAGENATRAIAAAIHWCWWRVGIWEGPTADSPAGTSIRVSRRRCDRCGGSLQERLYPDTGPFADRVTFWCISRDCSHNQ